MGDVDLSHSLHEVIGAISSQLRLRFIAPGAGELGFVAMATLRHLTRHGGRTVSQLAAADHVTTQAISLRIRPLVEAGLVTRTTDPEDGRRTVVQATSRGRRVVSEARSRAQRATDDAVGRLTTSELAVLSAALPALRQLAKNLEEQ